MNNSCYNSRCLQPFNMTPITKMPDSEIHAEVSTHLLFPTRNTARAWIIVPCCRTINLCRITVCNTYIRSLAIKFLDETIYSNTNTFKLILSLQNVILLCS